MMYYWYDKLCRMHWNPVTKEWQSGTVSSKCMFYSKEAAHEERFYFYADDDSDNITLRYFNGLAFAA